MDTIDLHIHSNYSDGKFSPKEIIDIAKQNNVKYIFGGNYVKKYRIDNCM